MFKLIDRLITRFTPLKPPTLEIVCGDITQIQANAIVNAAKPSLLGGGGVDGAIHAAAGPGLLQECKEVAARLPGGHLTTGSAIATNAYELPADYVIHTVGPRYDRQPYTSLLRCCYTSSLAVANGLECEAVSFPLISSGVYGWPTVDAIVQAGAAIRGFRSRNVKAVRLVLFDTRTYELAKTLLGHS